jgi:hypothetical protein
MSYQVDFVETQPLPTMATLEMNLSAPTSPYRPFDTVESAFAWMTAEVDDSCVDNLRVAYLSDEAALLAYEDTKNEGCCGFFDTIVLINGQEATIGCNYGH